MAAPDPNRPEPGPDAGIEDIEADAEQTRKELGQTVEALADKLDVKGARQREGGGNQGTCRREGRRS